MQRPRFFLVVVGLLVISGFVNVRFVDAEDRQSKFTTIVMSDHGIEEVSYDSFTDMFLTSLEILKQPWTIPIKVNVNYVSLMKFPDQKSYDQFTGAKYVSLRMYRDENGKCWSEIRDVIAGQSWKILSPGFVEC